MSFIISRYDSSKISFQNSVNMDVKFFFQKSIRSSPLEVFLGKDALEEQEYTHVEVWFQ